MLMSAELNGCVTWFIYFVDLLWIRYDCTKFHHCGICATDFMEGGPFCPPPFIREQPWKSPSWIVLTNKESENSSINKQFFCLYTFESCLWKLQVIQQSQLPKLLQSLYYFDLYRLYNSDVIQQIVLDDNCCISQNIVRIKTKFVNSKKNFLPS